MRIYTRAQIKSLHIRQHLAGLMQAIENELIQFANGRTVVLMPLHLDFAEAKGECHVKAGYTRDDSLCAIKIATGFYNNHALGLPAGDGLIVIICKKTGMINAILCDEGYLTTLRTAITACIAAKLTPWPIARISIVGTGTLARLLLEIIQQLYPKIDIYLWGRNQTAVADLQREYPGLKTENDLSLLIKKGGLVITTTASNKPLIDACDIDKKIHIIAVGADQPNKQELDVGVLAIADQIMVDCQEQAQHFGDSAIALKAGTIKIAQLTELGHVLQSRINVDVRVIITDLTGIAPQDIGIAKYVLASLKNAQSQPELPLAGEGARRADEGRSLSLFS